MNSTSAHTPTDTAFTLLSTEVNVADPSKRRLLIAGAASLALLLPTRSLHPQRSDSRAAHGRERSTSLRMGMSLAAGAETAELRRGAEMGVEEAARTAALLGTVVELVSLPDPLAEPGSLAAALAAENRPHVLLGGSDTESAIELSRLAELHGVLFMNIGADADSLRDEHCRRSTFHVAPSSRMKADARRIAGAGDEHYVAAWHPALERFGAGQLTDRHEARFGRGMSADGWCGWAAAKVAAEASLRSRSVEPAVLIALLESPRTRFDVHKGLPVGFRPWNHQLRQPLYVIDLEVGDAGRVIAEVPQPRDAAGRSWNELLDTLGTSPSTTSCSWTS